MENMQGNRRAGMYAQRLRMYLTALIAASSLTVCGSAAAQALPAADARQFRRAVESAQAGQHAAAERLLEELALKYPSHPDVHEALATVLDLQGKVAAATPHFEIAARGKPSSADLRLNLGVNYARQSRLEDAEREFHTVLRLRPADATAHFNLGTLLMRRERFDAALPHLQQARRLQPGDFSNGYQLALCYFLLRRHADAQVTLDAFSAPGDQQGEYLVLRGLNLKVLGRDAAALRALDRAWTVLPPAPEMLATLGPLFSHVGLTAEGLPWFEQIWRHNPESLPATTYLARAQFAAGRLQLARTTLMQALEKWPSADLHHLMGEVEEQLGNYVGAAQHLQRAAELNPSESNLYDLGYEFLAHWSWDAALTVFENAAGRYPKSARIRLGTATAHFAKGDYSQAVDSLLAASALEPRREMAHRMLASIFPLTSGKANVVLPRLRAFAIAEPANPWANYTYALALWQNPDRPPTEEEMAEAARRLARAAEKGTTIAEIQYHLGLLLSERGEWEQAARTLETAARLKPDYVEAHYRLALAYQRLGRSEQARATMDRCVKMKQEQDARLDERTAKTATFLFDLKP
jgi:tetratricopeptide (TPR) repeat protein